MPRESNVNRVEGGPSSFLPLFFVFLSGIGFSIQTLIIKLLHEDDGFSGSFQIIFFRGFTQISLASLFIYLNRSTNAETPLFGSTNSIKLLLFLRSLFGYGGIAFAFLSVEKMPIGDSTVLIMLSTIFASIASYFVLGEPWRLGELIATVVSLMGVILVSRPPALFGEDDAADAVGVVFALLAAVSAGVAYTTVRMLGTTSKMPWENVCFSQAIGQIVLSPPSLIISGQRFRTDISLVQVGLIFIAGFVGAWSQIAMTVGMQREKSALATGMRMSDVLFGFFWQALFTSEAVTSLSIAGAFLVVSSVLILVFSKAYYSREAAMKLDHPDSQVYSTLHQDSSHNSQSEPSEHSEADAVGFESLTNNESSEHCKADDKQQNRCLSSFTTLAVNENEDDNEEGGEKAEVGDDATAFVDTRAVMEMVYVSTCHDVECHEYEG